MIRPHKIATITLTGSVITTRKITAWAFYFDNARASISHPCCAQRCGDGLFDTDNKRTV
jgi:hypothetical protein